MLVRRQAAAPWHFLYFLPEPQGHGSFRPTLAAARTGFGASACAGPAWNCRFSAAVAAAVRSGARSRNRAWPIRRPAAHWGRGRFGVCGGSPAGCSPCLRLGRPHEKQESHRFGVDPVHHVFEKRERLALELDERIFLPVAAKPDAFFQVIERQQVVFPLARRRYPAGCAVQASAASARRKAFLSLRSAPSLFPSTLGELIVVQILDVDARRFQIEAELVQQFVPELRYVPLVGMLLARAIRLHKRIARSLPRVRARTPSGRGLRETTAAASRPFRAACSSRRRIRAGVCALRSSALPPLSARSRCAC